LRAIANKITADGVPISFAGVKKVLAAAERPMPIGVFPWSEPSPPS
jgi:hypothetical protein